MFYSYEMTPKSKHTYIFLFQLADHRMWKKKKEKDIRAIMATSF